jgi:hypothetical protein
MDFLAYAEDLCERNILDYIEYSVLQAIYLKQEKNLNGVKEFIRKEFSPKVSDRIVNEIEIYEFIYKE